MLTFIHSISHQPLQTSKQSQPTTSQNFPKMVWQRSVSQVLLLHAMESVVMLPRAHFS